MVLFIFIMHAMERDKMDFGGNKKPHQDKEINNKEIYKKNFYIFFFHYKEDLEIVFQDK